VHKTLNLHEKEHLLDFVTKLRKQYTEEKVSETQKKDESENLTVNQNLESSLEIFYETVEANKKLLGILSASKIRINEFMAIDFVPVLENCSKLIQGIEQGLILSSKNWDNLSLLPSSMYHGDYAEETCNLV